MFGIDALKQSIKDGFDSTAAILVTHTQAINELREMVDRTSTVVKATAIDTNRRLSVVEADRTRMLGAIDTLREYEESHAVYINHTVNGFSKPERTPHDCALCVAARKYL